MALNEYNRKNQNINITKAKYQALIAGAKTEEIQLIDAAIHTLQNQINATLNRINSYTITAPISGILTSPAKSSIGNENIARIIQPFSMILTMPIDLNHAQHINQGMLVHINSELASQPNSRRNSFY